MDIEADFRKDLIERTTAELRAKKFKITVDPDRDWWVLVQFCDLEVKFVPPRPRKVVRHPEFTCPDENREGLELFFAKVERGEELMRHGNKRIMRANKIDELLTDWKVHHFHLGTVEEADGFIKRTPNVLFARVTADELYALAVWPHEDENEIPNWGRDDLLKIIRKNWPQLIEHGHMRGVLGTETQATNEEIQRLRASGINYIPNVDGAVYVNLGGGIGRSKRRQADPDDTAQTMLFSHAARKRAGLYLRTVEEAEKILRECADEIPGLAEKQGKVLPENPRFKLEWDEGFFYGVEPTSGLSIRLIPRPPRPY